MASKCQFKPGVPGTGVLIVNTYSDDKYVLKIKTW
jgi:hypothetical protein